MNTRKINQLGGSKRKINHQSKGKNKNEGKKKIKSKRKGRKTRSRFTQMTKSSSSRHTQMSKSLSNNSAFTVPQVVELIILMHGDIPIKIVPTKIGDCNPENLCFYFMLENNVNILSTSRAGCRNKKPGFFFSFITNNFIRDYDGNHIFTKYIETLKTELHTDVGKSNIKNTGFNRSKIEIDYTTTNITPVSGETHSLTINKRYSKYEKDVNYGIYFASAITILTKKGIQKFNKGDNLLQCEEFIEYTSECISRDYNQGLFSEDEIRAGGNTTKEAVINFFNGEVNIIDESCSTLASVDETDLSILEHACENFSAEFYGAISEYP